MGKAILILTEADEQVASGHLNECIVLAQELDKSGYNVSLWVNEDIPKDFLKNSKMTYFTYRRPVQEGILNVIDYMEKESVAMLVLNLRKAENELILTVKQNYSVQVLCIDEFGNRRLDCDIIVNPMIDKSYGWYEGNYREKYIGNQYLILPIKYYEWNKKEKKINSSIHEITVSMGGVDIKNTTQRIANWLQRLKLDIGKVNVVLGGGYPYSDELRHSIWRKDFYIFQNITYLDELFYKSDIAFCAGGNTLHELACIGTAAITIPTMPHEYRNGKAFEKIGFGKCYKNFDEFDDSMEDQFESYFDEKKRKLYMDRGKRHSDGKGYLRMLKIIDNALV